MLTCAVHIIIDLNGVKVDETYFILLIVAGTFIYVLTGIIASKIKIKQLILLDEILDAEENFDQIQSVSQFYALLLTGFQIDPSTCIFW
jgi:hypothetical protein